MNATIIGAGITGLTIAVAMQQKGLHFTLYEAATNLKPVGAGIILSPNALYVYDRLGLYDLLKQHGQPLHSFNIVDAQGTILQKNDTTFSLNNRQYTSLAIHRADLQQVLLTQLSPEKLRLGHALEHYDLLTNELHFSTRKTVQANYVLGCDGIHSQIRQTLFPDSKLRYSGQTCWRGVAKLRQKEQLSANPAEMWGNGLRFGFVPLTGERFYWYATAVLPPHGKGSPLAATKENLRQTYQEFAPVVGQLIQNSPAIMRHDLLDLVPLTSWSRENALLLGDAAHAMTPNMGQGAAQGIEDAWAIVNLLEQHDNPKTAFTAFEQARFAKANEVAKLSWQIGQVTNWQNKLACRLRNGLFRLVPTAVSAKQRAKLFSVPHY